MSDVEQPVHFNVADDAWIPVVGLDGAHTRISLREAFRLAHTIRAIQHPVPIIELGVWRLMIAIATDVLSPADSEALREILDLGRFDSVAFDAYFDAWSKRLELFSTEWPFLQHAAAAGEDKPLAAISPLVPSGTNSAHWHKRGENAFGACPACAALLLTTVAPAMTAGGAGLSPSINGAPPYYTMLSGATLFERVTTNIWADAPTTLRGGAPSWRSGRSHEVQGRRSNATLLDGYTWQPRTLRLKPGTAGRCSLCDADVPSLVRTMHFTRGDACDIPSWRDPNVAYVTATDKTTPLRPREDREPWRDLDALLLLADEARGSRRRPDRPAIVSQYADLARGRDRRSRAMTLRLYGMRTDLKMKVFEWAAEDLVLPVPLIPNEKLYRTLIDAVSDADFSARAIASAIAVATKRKNFDHRDLTKSLARPAGRRFWTELRGPFQGLSTHMALRNPKTDGAAIAEDVTAWQSAVQRAARRAFDGAMQRLRMNAEQLIATERGRQALEMSLARVRIADALSTKPVLA